MPITIEPVQTTTWRFELDIEEMRAIADDPSAFQEAVQDALLAHAERKQTDQVEQPAQARPIKPIKTHPNGRGQRSGTRPKARCPECGKKFHTRRSTCSRHHAEQATNLLKSNPATAGDAEF